MIKLYVRKNNAGTEMSAITEDRIAYVIEVWNLGFVEEDAVFEFAGVAHHHAVAHDHVFAHITAAANVAPLANPGRSLQDRALFNNRSCAYKNASADKRFADQIAQN